MGKPESRSSRFGSALRRSRRLLGISPPELGSSQFALRKSPRLLGTTNPKTASSQIALRKGPRLLGKSKESGQSADRSQIAPSKPTEPCKGYFYCGSAVVSKFSDIAKVKRLGRRGNFYRFRYGYTYRATDYRKVIWSGQAHSWTENSYGITWVAVHGVNSICVVTRNEIPDVTRFSNALRKFQVLQDFGKAIISEMEDLVHSPSTFPQHVDLSNEKPFAIVSVAPNTSNVEENCDEEYDETSALNFLQEKIKKDATFTSTETVQTAISAFQHLCRKSFNAKEIRVFELRADCMWDLFVSNIYKHLADIPGSAIQKGSTDEYTCYDEDDDLPKIMYS